MLFSGLQHHLQVTSKLQMQAGVFPCLCTPCHGRASGSHPSTAPWQLQGFQPLQLAAGKDTVAQGLCLGSHWTALSSEGSHIPFIPQLWILTNEGGGVVEESLYCRWGWTICQNLVNWCERQWSSPNGVTVANKISFIVSSGEDSHQIIWIFWLILKLFQFYRFDYLDVVRVKLVTLWQ